MKTLGDNDERGATSLGGLRLGHAGLRAATLRKGSILYGRLRAFSIINGAAADNENRLVADGGSDSRQQKVSER